MLSLDAVAQFEKLGIDTGRGQMTAEQYKEFKATIKANDLEEQYEQNANEVMHTSNTGAGAEMIPGAILSQKIIDLTPTFQHFLPALSMGFQGNGLPDTLDVTVIGETGHSQGAGAERTSNAIAYAQARNRLATGKVTLTQVPMISIVDLSQKQADFNIAGERIGDLIARATAVQVARDEEAMIINGDTEAGASGNVNSDNQAPATTYATEGGAAYYATQHDNGLRKMAFDNSETTDLGALDFDDYITMMSKIGAYADSMADCMWLANSRVRTKSLGIAEFKNEYQNGRGSTIYTGALSNVLGADYFVNRDQGLTMADGKIDSTGNTKGQLILVHKPSIIWGRGKAPRTQVIEVLGQGLSFITLWYFAFAVSYQKAGNTSSSLHYGFNITV